MNHEFVSQQHWDKGYERCSLSTAAPDDPIRMLLERHLPNGPLSSLELGCHPGRYLSVLGTLGHTLNGIDLTPKVESELPEWLMSLGYKLGTFVRADVFKHEPRQAFDVVCSFGLIEHFTDWEELFLRHVEWVSPEGYLVISTPNFRSKLQHFLHATLDGANLERHNLKAMDPDRWRELAEKVGFEVIQCGGIGHFELWADNQKRNLFQRLALKVIRGSKSMWKLVPENTLALSPYYVLIARRPPASAS